MRRNDGLGVRDEEWRRTKAEKWRRSAERRGMTKDEEWPETGETGKVGRRERRGVRSGDDG